MTLNVLVLESERGAADSAIDDLEAAGHTVVRCHEPGAPSFPCNALADDPHCPLRTGVVDVALTVRPRPRSQPAPHEDGVTCALESHIPVVVAGSALMNPYNGYAAEVVDGTSNVVAAVERAAVAPMARHGEVALRALRGVLAVHEVDDPGAHVSVTRKGGRLHVSVEGARHLDHAIKSVASVRIIGALRALDSDAGGIDVMFDGDL
ncbi:MAG TPA: hypothetical protein VFR41_05080 [Acidimicrobiia bacterium]|nr:hypothetical protein [Acidimicrobiia bacterium]